MDLTLYNTLTGKKELFKPLDPSNVRMYVCGPTVYDYAHIGNARPVIVFDVLYRLLRYVYGPDHVTYARNITDVDDKINARAAEEGVPISKITARTTRQFHDDIAALGVLPPTVEPRATDHIEQMKALIETLVEKGNAYVAEDHVLFHVPSMPEYGKLSKRSLDEMEAGARVEVAPYKKDAMDFVLWKPSKKGEPAWDSPCDIERQGRPGWHIECSAMSAQHLGEVFDIHGGGIDLVFPHHENEIAQSRCGFGTEKMAQIWMHNGYLQIEGRKMSKSEGNFITIHDLLQEWPGDVIRMQMLMTHYRLPLDWTASKSELVRDELSDWAHVLEGYFEMEMDRNVPEAVLEALSDDLNTSDAITVLRELYSSAKDGALDEQLDFAAACRFMGFQRLNRPGLFDRSFSGTDIDPKILFDQSENFDRLRAAVANNAPQVVQSEIISEMEGQNYHVEIRADGTVELQGKDHSFTKRVEQMINARNAARAAKDFKEADRIRDELAEMGIHLKDVKDPKTGEPKTEWEIAR